MPAANSSTQFHVAPSAADNKLIGVCEPSIKAEFWPALQDRIHIYSASTGLKGELLLGNSVEKFGQVIGFDAAMRFDNADDHIHVFKLGCACN